MPQFRGLLLSLHFSASFQCLIIVENLVSQLNYHYSEPNDCMVLKPKLTNRFGTETKTFRSIDGCFKFVVGFIFGNPESSLLSAFQEAEKHLSDMVVSKSLVAKVDRPMGVACFQTAKDSNEVLNSWATNLEKLLDLVEKSCHQIHKEVMVHKATLTLE